MYYSTREVAKKLKVQPDRLQKAIWLGKVDSPIKSPSGDFLWTEKDIERAAWALNRFSVLQGGKNER